MPLLSTIAASGLQAAQVRLQAAAHNVANGQTEGFHRQTVRQQARPDGAGVQATVARAPDAGADMHADAIDQLAATAAMRTNLAVFRTGQRLLGTLLDERA